MLYPKLNCPFSQYTDTYMATHVIISTNGELNWPGFYKEWVWVHQLCLQTVSSGLRDDLGAGDQSPHLPGPGRALLWHGQQLLGHWGDITLGDNCQHSVCWARCVRLSGTGWCPGSWRRSPSGWWRRIGPAPSVKTTCTAQWEICDFYEENLEFA